MATCPHCSEFLGEHHRCRGLWRLRIRRVGASALMILGGALVSTAMLYTVNSDPSGLIFTIVVLIGAIIGQAVRTATRH